MQQRSCLVFGGTSSERRVSVASAQHLAQAYAWEALWFVAPDGAVYASTRAALMAHARPFERDFVPVPATRWLNLEVAAREANTVLFLALHGGDGENGVVQRRLEALGVAFTGSGSHASALAFDKVRTKAALVGAGVRVPHGTVLEGRQQGIAAALTEALTRHGRLVTKPVADGSSMGLHHIRNAADVGQAASDIARAGVPYVMEEHIEGVEVTCGIVEDADGHATALPLTEVRLAQGAAFDYAGKYLGAGCQEITPAEVGPDITRQAQSVGLKAHATVGCRGYSRSDLIVEPGKGVVFLEINTLPGLTKASFIPQQLQAAGRSLENFVDTQLVLARKTGRSQQVRA